MNHISFILLQAESGGEIPAIIIASIIVIAVFIGIFLLIRTLMLWYWKVDIIVNNQKQQNELLKHQVYLLQPSTRLKQAVTITT